MHLSEGSGKPIPVVYRYPASRFEETTPSLDTVKDCEKIDREIRRHIGDLLKVTGLGLLIIIVMGTVRFTNWYVLRQKFYMII